MTPEQYNKESEIISDLLYKDDGMLIMKMILGEVGRHQVALMNCDSWEDVLRLQGKVKGLMSFYNGIMQRVAEYKETKGKEKLSE